MYTNNPSGRTAQFRIFQATASALTFVLALSALPSRAQDSLASVPADTVLLSSSRVQVTVADLEAEISRIPEKDRTEFLMSRQRLAKMVEGILINKTLALEARQNGLDKDPKVAAEILNQTEKVLAKYRGQQLKKVPPDAQLLSKAREDYLVNKDKFKRPKEYRIWFFQVSRLGRTNEETRRLAESFLKRAKEPGTSLTDLARQFSDDPTADQNGGEAKPVPPETLDPAIAQVVTKMKPGEFSGVIESHNSFYLVKLLEIIPEINFTFEQLKGDLMQDARNAYQGASLENYLNTIRQDPTLKLDADALDAIRPKVPELPAPPSPPSASSPQSK